jgi:hypothetical protein
MKKILSALLVSVVASVAAYAQGTVNFVNLSSNPALNAPVFHMDNVTRLAGNTFMAELLGGTSSTSLSVQGAATPFLTAGGAGYFNGSTRVINGVAEGAVAFLQVRVWNTAFGADYAAALANPQSAALGDAWALSNIFSVTTGAPNGGPPPTVPATMVGLTTFHLNTVIPEPSTFALAGLGAAALLLFRRRK